MMVLCGSRCNYSSLLVQCLGNKIWHFEMLEFKQNTGTLKCIYLNHTCGSVVGLKYFLRVAKTVLQRTLTHDAECRTT